MLYTEVWTQTHRLIEEGINLQHKLLRMRARPKILLCSNYEEAAEQTLRYRDHLLGVIMDVEFPRGGNIQPETGFHLAQMIRDVVPDVPIVLQSSRTEYMDRAFREGFSFVQKNSPTLLSDLRKFLIENVGFGDFVFRLPDQTEVGRASDLNQLEQLLHTVPAESIAYHAERNHFSHWFMTRTEFALAQKLRPTEGLGFLISGGAAPKHYRTRLRGIAMSRARRRSATSILQAFSPSTHSSCESATVPWAEKHEDLPLRAAFSTRSVCRGASRAFR